MSKAAEAHGETHDPKIEEQSDRLKLTTLAVRFAVLYAEDWLAVGGRVVHGMRLPPDACCTASAGKKWACK